MAALHRCISKYLLQWQSEAFASASNSARLWLVASKPGAGPLATRQQTGNPGGTVFLPRQEVALHYPRCVLDLEILDFLLDYGADASIARYFHSGSDSEDEVNVVSYPVQRHSGDILQMAANCGASETVITMLMQRGHTKLMYGTVLHSLMRRKSESKDVTTVDHDYRQIVSREQMEHPWPVLSNRFDIAAHLIKLGEDVDVEVNV
ncbi:hypothetical protein CC79DRAFT_1362456 [Sarocladium strictum]